MQNTDASAADTFIEAITEARKDVQGIRSKMPLFGYEKAAKLRLDLDVRYLAALNRVAPLLKEEFIERYQRESGANKRDVCSLIAQPILTEIIPALKASCGKLYDRISGIYDEGAPMVAAVEQQILQVESRAFAVFRSR